MPIDRLRAIGALALAVLTSACVTSGDTPWLVRSDNFGEATRATFAAQVIDPMPAYDTAIGETSGEHAAQAVSRYRTNTVKRPDRIQASTNADASERTREVGDSWGDKREEARDKGK